MFYIIYIEDAIAKPKPFIKNRQLKWYITKPYANLFV